MWKHGLIHAIHRALRADDADSHTKVCFMPHKQKEDGRTSNKLHGPPVDQWKQSSWNAPPGLLW